MNGGEMATENRDFRDDSDTVFERALFTTHAIFP